MMKRALACALAVAFLAGTASALSVGPGMYIYSSLPVTSGGLYTGVSLYQTTINSHWDNTTKAVNFQTLTCSVRASSSYGDLRRVEVWNPRASGGTGELAVTGPFTTYYGAPSNTEHQPYDVVLVDPTHTANNLSFSTAAGNLLVQRCSGTDGYNGKGGTEKLYGAYRTPTNWGGTTTNNVGMLLNSSTHGLAYRFDTNVNGTCDNTTSEFKDNAVTNGTSDGEFALDGSFYDSAPGGSGSFTGFIYRNTISAGTIQASTTLASVGGAGNPMGGIQSSSSSLGLATGGTVNRPIIYASCADNSGGTTRTYTTAIFALVDGDADGKALWSDSNDKVVEIWRSGDAKLGFGLTEAAVYDIEYVKDDNGAQYIVFCGGTASSLNFYNLYALQLADNGLAATGLKTIGANLVGRYFEIDQNPSTPSSVPEPTTLALLGTSALGALGWLRRRRLK